MKWFAGVLCCLLVCCKNTGDEKSVANAPESVQFRLSPDFDKAYRYVFINESRMRQKVNDEDFENDSKLEIQTAYTFSKDTAARWLLKTVYEKFNLAIKAMGQEKKLDASTAANSFESSDRMFAAFHNAVITASVDSFGNTTNISGIEEIRKKMAEFAGDDEDAQSMLNGSISQYVNEQFFKLSIESSLKSLTTRRLRIGDTIMVATPVGGELNISASVIYKLESISGPNAVISTSADFDLKDQSLKIDNTNVNANINGEQKGEIIIDHETGLLQRSSSVLKLKGSMQIMGVEAPFSMKTTNTIRLLR